MSHYHLMHCIAPDPRAHGLNGYKELIETVAWGLEQLGHRVSYAVNETARDATNIIFGAQVMPMAALERLPRGTIIYNLEQLRGLPQIRQEIRYYANAPHFEVWDYTQANAASWHALGRQVKIVPIGYAPILSRIPKPPRQDIDVLIYGMSGERRMQTVHALSLRGLSTVFVSGLYGAARDELISRTRIVLNINLYAASRIFEIVRVSYLLANRKAVVSDLDADTSVDDDIRPAVKFVSSLAELMNVCESLARNDQERAKLEELGFSCISRRDVREILKGAVRD